MMRLSQIAYYQEKNSIKAEKAEKGLPRSIWESYSAFANTFGGLLLLGAEEMPDHTLQISGVQEPERRIQEFWHLANNTEFLSANILSDEKINIQEIDGKKIIGIEIPRAASAYRPVYLGKDPYEGSFRRDRSGVYHCTALEVDGMLRGRKKGRDKRVLGNFTFQNLDRETIARYRQRFAQIHPGHPWLSLTKEEFLEKLGGGQKIEGKWHPTAAGLLMFGEEQAIIREFPSYFLAYRELKEKNHWEDVVLSTSGDWSGNLCDFYSCIHGKMTASFLSFLGPAEMEASPLRKVIREILVNAIIHADYEDSYELRVLKNKDRVVITNPGELGMVKEEAIKHGVQDAKNPILREMFSWIGLGQGTGEGLPMAIALCKKYHLGEIQLQEQLHPDTVTLKLKIQPDCLK